MKAPDEMLSDKALLAAEDAALATFVPPTTDKVTW